MGVLSALPLINLGNLCCCLWVVSGGVVAAYLLQQNQPAPITAADGALVGLLAGITGAVIHLIVSIPVSIMMAPLLRGAIERVLENAQNVPAELREFAGNIGGGIELLVGLMFMLCIGSIFSTLGGLLGVAIFRKQPPPGVIDVPPSH
jgi:hypothetical protein